MLTRSRYTTVVLFTVIVLMGGCRMKECNLQSGTTSSKAPFKLAAKQTTEKQWAERFELPGVPNLYKVSEDLYRGAQPSAEGMKQLEKLGVKTIINLRSSHSDRNELKETGLAHEHIEMTPWNPESEDVVHFLQIVSDRDSMPVFVHCQHGADRTGLMCAIYRIVEQNWSKDEAIEEMTKGGFGFHEIWDHLPDYIRELDIDQVKHKAHMNK